MRTTWQPFTFLLALSFLFSILILTSCQVTTDLTPFWGGTAGGTRTAFFRDGKEVECHKSNCQLNKDKLYCEVFAETGTPPPNYTRSPSDTSSRKNIVNQAYIMSEDSLCRMAVERRIDGARLTGFRCSFEFLYGGKSIKFDNDHNLHFMNLIRYSNNKFHADRSAYVEPIRRNPTATLSPSDYANAVDPYYVAPDPPLSYENFINGLISAKTVAIELIPTIDHEYYNFKKFLSHAKVHGNDRLNSDPVWIRFSLKGAKEAIAKLGKEL